MENRIQRVFLSALFTALALPVLAADEKASSPSEQVIVPDLKRRISDKPNIDSQDFEVGAYYGILSIQDFGSNSVIGATLTYHVTEDNFIEFEYGESEGDQTSFERLSGSAQLLDSADRTYKYYSANIGGNIFPGEIFVGSKYAFMSSFYATAGIGGTEFGGDSVFTLNFGVGYRVLLNDWFAIRFDARDYIFERDLFGEKERVNNLELRTGFSVFF